MPSVNVTDVNSSDLTAISSIPCKIHADCHADVNSYFRRENLEKDRLSASFRGFPLDGVQVNLPEGYTGLVLNIDDSEVQNHACVGRFDQMTYWNWNKRPTKNDPLLAAFDWIDVAAAIHGPADL